MSEVETPGVDVVERAVASFEAAVAAGRLAQAYMVIGSLEGQGMPFADAVLGRLFCRGMVKPCGEKHAKPTEMK